MSEVFDAGNRKMNGSNEGQQGPDRNANVDTTKGAIPKTRPFKPKSTKRAIKINNNVEEVGSVNCNLAATGVCLNNGVSSRIPPVCPIDDQSETCEESQSDSPCSSCVLGGNEGVSEAAGTSKVALKTQKFCRKKDVSEEDDEINDECEDEARNDDVKHNLSLELNNSDDNSSIEDDLLSISDDGCIYTYKGDHMADLPSSFFSLDVPAPVPELVERRQQTSSPEMDFLEMDFDPGPLDGDSECGEVQNNTEISGNVNKNEERKQDQGEASGINALNDPLMPSTSTSFPTISNYNKRGGEMSPCGAKKEDLMPWSCPVSHRTTASNVYRNSKRFHYQKGELISPSEKFSTDYVKLPKLPYYLMSGNKENEASENLVLNLKSTSAMIWNESEANLRQFTQIGPSACGATAVLNVLTALRFPIPPIEKLQELVNTRLRANSSPLTEYLQSRSNAGTNHKDLIEGLHKLSDGKIYARFFPMYPERIVNLEAWLVYWISNGAVPIATLNLQKCSGTIPDAWHHQMIFGVSPKGIYLTNPLECVEPGKLWAQLSSESTLLVRREDVISRWNFKTDLPQLMNIMDVRWRQLNVVGQVANMIHEHRRELKPGFMNTTHIKIPACYSAGITLAVNVDSKAYTFLQQCPELPYLNASDTASALTC